MLSDGVENMFICFYPIREHLLGLPGHRACAVKHNEIQTPLDDRQFIRQIWHTVSRGLMHSVGRFLAMPAGAMC